MTARRVLVPCFLSLLVVACGPAQQNADLQAFMQAERAQTGGRIEPLPAYEPYELIVYSAAGLRSPFEPPQTLIQRQVSGQPTTPPDTRRPPEFLERFNVAELNMVGSISREGVRWGLIVDTAGTIHRVREGNHMGKNHGRIVRIDETLVEILEKVPDGRGGWVERPRTINMNISP